VIVVGTGIAGLYCAHYLTNNGVDVVMVEANNWVGGRIKAMKGWVHWKTLDLGAEFIHGKETLLNKIVDENGFPSRLMFTWAQGDGEHPEELFGKEFAGYFLGKEKKLLPYNTQEPDIVKTNEVLYSLSDVDASPNDPRTLEEYLKQQGLSENGLKLAEAGYSNTLCTTSKDLSLYETKKINQAWDQMGHGDYRLENGMGEVTQYLARGIDIRLKWVVKSINYEGGVVTVMNDKGEKLYAPKVVVTVPLPILQEQSIKFTPSLPVPKQIALKQLKMENAIKMVCVFTQKFWPSKLGGIICIDTPIPEIWFETPERVGILTPESKNSGPKTVHNPTYIVSGFACATYAAKISKMSQNEVRDMMLAQLNDMFSFNKGYSIAQSEEATNVTNVATPATKFFLDFLMQDWSKEPHIKGGYSHPAIRSSQKAREDLGAPIGDKIFFAGEATHPVAYMTLGGAIDTGLTAAKAIINSLQQNKPIAKL